MKNEWQLAVVDLDVYKWNDGSALKKKFEQLFNDPDRTLVQSTVVYICSVAQIPCVKFGSEYDWDNPSYGGMFSNGVPIANVWIPKAKRYGYAPLYVLRPIVTEADAIEMEMKFSISLKDYVQ